MKSLRNVNNLSDNIISGILSRHYQERMIWMSAYDILSNITLGQKSVQEHSFHRVYSQ